MMPDDTAAVVFMPSGHHAEVAIGTSLLDAARELGVDLASICGGRGLCGRCQVVVPVGSFPKHGIEHNSNGVSAWTVAERDYEASRGLPEGRRLGCHARIAGPLVVDVPPDSQVHRQVVRKRPEVRDFAIDPIVTLHHVEVEPPTLVDARGDLQRLRVALRDQWDVAPTGVDRHVLTRLPGVLRSGGWAVTLAVRDGSTITAVWPGLHETAHGVAIDIGSTTIAGHLMDLATGELRASAGVMNPQIRFGEDLMSRVSYAMMNEGGAALMTDVVREAVNELVGSLAREAEVTLDGMLEFVVVANPIMHHLFLGLDPVPLGTAPFALATNEAVEVRAADVGIESAAGARLTTLPCIAGHVGADAAGVVLSEAPHQTDAITLLVDVGTNAEIVLGTRKRLLAASSPTGPAFEGAQISSGQRATIGAIERVRIDPETWEARVKVIGNDHWSDEAGFDPGAVTGVCGSGVIEAIAEMFLAGVVSADGVINGDLAPRTDRVVANGRTFSYVLHEGRAPILITQEDVRAVQLAKAALHAGCTLLMEHLGVDHVDQIRLAGAFGSVIDPVHALVLGLVPDCEVSAVTAAGNAAASGAQIALLSKSARTEIERVTRSVEKVETATEPSFQDRFVAAMAIPHATDPYAKLATRVALPPRRTSRAGGVRRSRRAGSR